MILDSHDLLLEELDQTQQQLAALDHQLQHKPDFGLGVGSPEIVTWEMNLARRAALLERITDIEQALTRRASGNYGACDICGTPIDAERLRILPHTTRCVRCASLPPGGRARSRPKMPG
jgi:RNA polymerase-binding transcription factor DksA